MEQTIETLLSLDQPAYIRKFTESNVRPDSRPLYTVRPTTIVPTILPRNTHGSSLIRLGKTQIISAITLSVGQPSPSLPYNGEVDVSVNFSPLCGKQYNIHGRVVHNEEGSSATAASVNASDPQAIESFVKRTVLGSDMVDLKALCLEEGKSAWKLHISCVVVNHDGNVVDAVLLGCVSALQNFTLPLTKVINSGNSQEDGKVQIILPESEDVAGNSGDARKNRRLTLRKLPVPLTIGIFEGKLLVDPTITEEAGCEGMITVVVDALELGDGCDNKSNAGVVSIQKIGNGISVEKIALSVQLCFGRAEEMKQILSDGIP